MTGARKSKFLTPLFFSVVSQFILASSHPASCEADLSNTDAGLSLLQKAGRVMVSQSLDQGPQDTSAGVARRLLPDHLFKLGLKLFQDESILDVVVNNTRLETSEYAEENVTFRIPIGDQVDKYDNYGIDSLKQMAANENGMMNMLDIGGNLGRVSIAAFMKRPQEMRVVVVEPVPVTFFLLSWNLWLNDIPQRTLNEFKQFPMQAGVVALNNGISYKEEELKGLCWTPPYTMGSRICDCDAPEEVEVPQLFKRQCSKMVGRNIDYFLNIFGNEAITLLKMDCEGCEFGAIPSLVKLLHTKGQKIVRFAGELHEVPNALEDFACKFEGGRWFGHVCAKEGTWQNLRLDTRCLHPNRASCNRNEADRTGNLFEDVQSA